MIDFDIIDINEAIEDMSHKKQLEFLNKKESEIKTTIEKSKNLLSYIKELKEEIERERP